MKKKEPEIDRPDESTTPRGANVMSRPRNYCGAHAGGMPSSEWRTSPNRQNDRKSSGTVHSDLGPPGTHWPVCDLSTLTEYSHLGSWLAPHPGSRGVLVSYALQLDAFQRSPGVRLSSLLPGGYCWRCLGCLCLRHQFARSPCVSARRYIVEVLRPFSILRHCRIERHASVVSHKIRL